ncbi:MAG TPA: hypothetical protein VK957_18900 [Lunatimonas sp.]|nr:hypothetical protein [Lunatimonas sp.]
MKHTQVYGIYLFCLLIVSGAIAWSCATKEMESLEPFQYVLDVIEVGELPDIEEEDPYESELEGGSINIPSQIQVILVELEGMGAGDEVSAETKNTVNKFSKALDTEEGSVLIRSIEEAKLTAVSSEDMKLDPELERFVQKVMGFPELAVLFPSLSYPQINGEEFRLMLLEETDPVDRLSPMGKPSAPNSPPGNAPGNPPGAPPVVDPPCRNAAASAHREAWDQLDMQRESQEALVLERFENRIASYQAAREESVTAFMDFYNERRGLFEKQAQLILRISNQLHSQGHSTFANNLKVIATVPVNARVQLESLKTVTLNAIVQTQRNNNSAAVNIGNNSINTISQNFSNAALDLQKKLDKALSRCLHNQGKGN